MNTKQLQERLIALGYDVGRAGADGIAGRDTIAAIAKFQKDKALPIRWPGTIGPTTIDALNEAAIAPAPGKHLSPTIAVDAPIWLAEARRFQGKHERRDAKELDKALGLDASEIPWCGAFVGMVLATVLPSEPMPANPLGARNWLKFGDDLGGPKVGAIAVFWRGSKTGWSGHVGFCVGHDATHVHVLGGNQSDAVTISRIAKDRLLGYRWPKTAGNPPATRLAETTISASITHNEA